MTQSTQSRILGRGHLFGVSLLLTLALTGIHRIDAPVTSPVAASLQSERRSRIFRRQRFKGMQPARLSSLMATSATLFSTSWRYAAKPPAKPAYGRSLVVNYPY